MRRLRMTETARASAEQLDLKVLEGSESLPGVLLVRFEVSVHDAVVVQIFQSQDSLSKVHPRHVDRQSADVLQQRGAVSTWTEQTAGG